MTVFSREEELPAGTYLCGCAVSGGSLSDYLRSARAAVEKLCAVLSPVYMDFPLPCTSGVGTALTEDTVKALRGDTPCYFSQSLCTEYFTYCKDGTAHVVLFDTPDSLLKKARAVEAAGISMILVPDPQLRKLLYC